MFFKTNISGLIYFPLKTLSPTIPINIKRIQIIRILSDDSLKSIIPKIVVPIIPIPVHAA